MDSSDDNDTETKQPEPKVTKPAPATDLRCDLCGKSAEETLRGCLEVRDSRRSFPKNQMCFETSLFLASASSQLRTQCGRGMGFTKGWRETEKVSEIAHLGA